MKKICFIGLHYIFDVGLTDRVVNELEKLTL